MVLDFVDEEENIFIHSREFEQGLGKIRKGAVTYVVAKDGSGDFATIKEAIKALPSTGGKVQIKEGIYSENNIIISKNNVFIEGIGLGTPEIRLGASNGFLISGATYTTLNNLYITGGIVSNIYAIHLKASNDCFIKNCYISQMTGVKLTNTSARNKIIDNVFFAGVDSALIISGANRNIIEGNYFSEASTTGISIDGNAKYNVINGNILYECYGNISVISGSNNIITNNNVTNNDISSPYDTSILINPNCNNNMIVGNNLIGVVGYTFTNNGTNTQIAHNITE